MVEVSDREQRGLWKMAEVMLCPKGWPIGTMQERGPSVAANFFKSQKAKILFNVN